jgi:acetyl esterase/lipase
MRLRWPRRLLVASALLVAVLGVTVAMGRGLGISLVNALSPRHGSDLQHDLAYGTLPRQKLDIYTPLGADAQTPVVVFFYGGGWQDGAKETYGFVGRALAGAGYIVAIPDYRLYPDVVFPSFAEDAADAVDFVARRFDVASGRRRLGLMGHSAGAHIALLLATDQHYLQEAGVPPTLVKAVVGLSGPYDFLPLRQAIYKAIFPEALRRDSQPINFVHSGEPPMLLLAGQPDPTVDPGNSRRLAKKIEEVGGSVEMRILPGVGHLGMIAAFAEINPFRRREVMVDTESFLASKLLPPVLP